MQLSHRQFVPKNNSMPINRLLKNRNLVYKSGCIATYSHNNMPWTLRGKDKSRPQNNVTGVIDVSSNSVIIMGHSDRNTNL